MVIYN